MCLMSVESAFRSFNFIRFVITTFPSLPNTYVSDRDLRKASVKPNLPRKTPRFCPQSCYTNVHNSTLSVGEDCD